MPLSYTLDNYKRLVARIDTLCSEITSLLGEQITCSAGCSSCCTAITIFPVEAEAMREALLRLPAQQADTIVRHLSKYFGDEQCPLLLDQHCLLYDARPIICRTHGLPIVYTTDGKLSSDCCPRNLTEATSVSGSNAVDIDTLNTLLAAVNSIYLTQSKSADNEDRVTIIDALISKKKL